MDKPKCFGSYEPKNRKAPCRTCNVWEQCKFAPPKPKRGRKPKEVVEPKEPEIFDPLEQE